MLDDRCSNARINGNQKQTTENNSILQLSKSNKFQLFTLIPHSLFNIQAQEKLMVNANKS